MSQVRGPLVWALLTGVLVAWASGCNEGIHPLDGDGTVEVFGDVDGPLFARRTEAYLTTRQEPYEMRVTLRMTRSGKPEHGAFVNVRVEPTPALSLLETDGTCSAHDGAFRCVGNGDGYAHFKVRSDAEWSGGAEVVVFWASTTAKLEVTIKPPGLPEGTSNFELIAEGTDGSEAARVRPAYPFDDLCSLAGNEPERWPAEGKTHRSAKLRVRAVAPPELPGSLLNAPVVLSSNSAEGEFSGSADCTERGTRRVVQLDAAGESEPAWICFSNVGGEVRVSAASGEVTSGPTRSFVVDPEPRLIQISRLVQTTPLDTTADLWQVVAYGAAYLEPIGLDVDLDSIGVPLAFRATSASLSTDLNAPTLVQVTPTELGSARIRVGPQFRPDKACDSPAVEVVPVELEPIGGAQ